ncbi:probable serine/threonine-protein kinase DDB_G0282963 [Oppia nitens]|uniref:probable serine/threonine-protein kinase DDB_G0282963 n=1 Tax=Oppia nitens TaxID=1686743 RepID=UPI0023D9EE0B|nr:probable serine/threonine-protein kinase DDB_G0282963 [Oppia nitens]
MIRPSLVGDPCGQHGNYTFYKAFRYQLKGDSRIKILSLGEFFFLRISPQDDPCIGELQLLWDDRNSDQLLSSTRLYFLPEQTPEGRLSTHGEHEVLAASEKVILRLNDLVSWITDQVDWMTGLKTYSSYNNKRSGDVSSCSSSAVVLSYPRYCRYRALLRRIEGKELDWMNSPGIQYAINSLGIPTTANKLNIVFCRDTFEHEALLQNDLNCDHLAPKLKGRPRKRTTAIVRNNSTVSGGAGSLGVTNTSTSSGGNSVANGSCARSSSPESNTSEESKTSQQRTTRRSALNKSNSTEKPTVQRRNSYGKCNNNNNSDNHIINNNTNSDNNNCNNNTTTTTTITCNNNNTKSINCTQTDSEDSNVNINSKTIITNDENNCAFDGLPLNGTKFKEMCIKDEQTFLKHLKKFMKDRKTPIQRVPHLGFKQIDLFFFWSYGMKLGGYEKITSNKCWKKLYDAMGGDPGSTSAATCTRRHYERLLLPFERYLNGKQEKKTRRKTTSTSSAIKKGKTKGSKNSTDITSTVGSVNVTKTKKKGKQCINDAKVKSKSSISNEDDDNDSDSDGSSDEKPSQRESCERLVTTSELLSKDTSDDDRKQPKLIVKLNLTKVKNNSPEDDDEEDEEEEIKSTDEEKCNDFDEQNDEEMSVSENKHVLDFINKKDMSEDSTSSVIKLDVQRIVDDMNTDTEDESDKKPQFDLKLKSEPISIKVEPISVKVEPTVAIDVDKSISDKHNTSNSDSVIHLSPVSDIEDEDQVSDNITQSITTISSSTTKVIEPLKATVSPKLEINYTKMDSNNSNDMADEKVTTSTAGAPVLLPVSASPYRVSASPLFSISTLVNSVKAEQLTSPPPTATITPNVPTLPYGSVYSPPSLTPPLQLTSQLSMISTKTKLYDKIVDKTFFSTNISDPPLDNNFDKCFDKSMDILGNSRQTVIKPTNNLLITAQCPTKLPPNNTMKNKLSISGKTFPVPAHSYTTQSLFRIDCDTSKVPEDILSNDVLDLSVKKRCLEADSRTSPSQILMDGSIGGLDLSIKKRKHDVIELTKQEVPKVKPIIIDQQMKYSLTPPMMSSLHTSIRSITPMTRQQQQQQPLQDKSSPHKLSPQLVVNNVPHCVQKLSTHQTQQTHHYHNSNNNNNINNINHNISNNKSYPQINTQKSNANNYNKQQIKTQTHQQSYQTVHQLSPHQTYPSSQSTRYYNKSVTSQQQMAYQTKQSQTTTTLHHLKDHILDKSHDKQHHHQQQQQQQQQHHYMSASHSSPQISHQKQQMRQHSQSSVPMVVQSQQTHHRSLNNTVSERYNPSPSSHRSQYSISKSSGETPTSMKQHIQTQSSPSVRSEADLSSKLMSPAIVPSHSSMPSIISSTSASIRNTTTTTTPAISEYNPSLPTFNPILFSSLATPGSNLWWQNTSSLHSSGVSTGTPYLSPTSSVPISQLSPHMLASHPLLSAAYPIGTQAIADHIMAAQLDSAKAANYAVYKQLLEQQQQQQQHHSQQSAPNSYQLFQHYYATK